MLNQIEKQFESFMQAMYGNQTISEAQEKDIEKSFFAGMLVCVLMLHSFSDDDEIAMAQVDTLYRQIGTKMGQLTKKWEQK